MAGKHDDLARLRELGQGTRGPAAAAGVEVYENIVGEDGNRTAHVVGGEQKRNAQAEVELLARAEREMDRIALVCTESTTRR